MRFTKPHIEKAEIGKKLLSEINDEDINLWKLEIEGKRTPQKKPLSTRRKNMSLDVLCQILRLAKRRGLANDKLLIDARPFKNEENEDEVNPLTEDEVEGLLKASEGWERSLLSVCFFTGMRRGEVLGLRWSGVFFDRDRILVRRSLTRHGESSPKSKTSFRYVQILPRVREELLKQRDRVKLRSEFVFPNKAWKALNVNWVTRALWPRLVEKADQSGRFERGLTTMIEAKKCSNLADDAVSCELFSASNSLITRESTGNFRDFGRPRRRVAAEKAFSSLAFSLEFPTQRIREF
jgi:integrase